MHMSIIGQTFAKEQLSHTPEEVRQRWLSKLAACLEENCRSYNSVEGIGYGDNELKAVSLLEMDNGSPALCWYDWSDRVLVTLDPQKPLLHIHTDQSRHLLSVRNFSDNLMIESCWIDLGIRFEDQGEHRHELCSVEDVVTRMFRMLCSRSYS